MSFAVNALTRSLNVFHLGGSACNNCDIEILEALTPRYDIERFGMVLVGSVRHADVILPAAAHAEKAGTYTNTNRQVQMARPVIDPPGEARADWAVVV